VEKEITAQLVDLPIPCLKLKYRV